MSADKGTLVMLAGCYLKSNDFISPLDLQNEVSSVPDLGYRPPLKDCQDILSQLEVGGFIISVGGNYTFAHKQVVESEESIQRWRASKAPQ